MLTILAKMVVNVLHSCNTARVPTVLPTRLKIRCVRPMQIILEWPFGTGNAKFQHATWAQHAQALTEEVAHWIGIVNVLKKMLRKNSLAAVGFERKATAKIQGQITSWEEINVEVAVFSQ